MNDNKLQDQDTDAQETSGAEEISASAGAAEAGGAGDGADQAGEIESLRLENVDLRNRLLREMAEMENLRKRTRREKADASRFAIAKFARDLLTVGDDLRRAIDAAPADAHANAGDPVETLLSGVEATERQLLSILERHGVRRYEPLGEKFDPTHHEALFELPDPAIPNGTIMQVVEAGYMIGERVLRPARVGVAKGGPRYAPKTDAPRTPEPAEAQTGADGHPAPESTPHDDGPPISVPTSDDVENTDIKSSDGGGVGGRVDRTA